MTDALEVIAPGLHTTVQDLGRVGYRDVGVPESGPLDRVSFHFANVLVGNAPNTPALEVLVQGPTLKVTAESVRVACVGGEAHIELRNGEPRRIAGGRSVRLVRDDVFRIGTLGDSICAYLAVEGGIGVAQVLGSASTYVRGGLGGFQGRRLARGDLVPLALESVEAGAERTLARPLDLALDQPIRVILGPQAEYFTDDAIETFLNSEYTVSAQSDRMGFRLEGPVLEHANGYDLVSDGIVAGAIQVPGSGKPIVLMADHQTTGGYPKIATVVSADLPVIGRRRPGRRLRFVSVDVREAARLRKKQETALEREVKAIKLIA
jgi:allophanate hydrolase